MILPVGEGILFVYLFTHFITCDNRFNSVVLFLFFFLFKQSMGIRNHNGKKKKKRLMEVYIVVFVFTKLNAEM